MKMYNLLLVLIPFISTYTHEVPAQSSDDVYFIQSTVGEKYLDVINANPKRLAPIHIWKFTGFDSQKFTLKDAGEGYFYILSNTRDNRVLHVEDENKKPKAKVSLWELKDKDNFKWKLINTDNHYYIQSKLGTYLALQRYEDVNGTPLWMWEAKGDKGLKWKLKFVESRK